MCEISKMRVLAILALVLAACSATNFETCPGFDNSPVSENWSFSVNPDPIAVQAGAEIMIHFFAETKVAVPVGTKAKLKLKKIGIEIPCLPVSSSKCSLYTSSV